MRVLATPDGNIEITDAEDAVLRTLGETESYQGRMAVIHYLKHYCNAEKVLKVIQLTGNKVQGCYTICPIAEQIGDRTAEQYVEDSRRAHEAWVAERQQQLAALKKR